MTRVKRGKIAHKRRKRVLKQTKGYKWRRSKTYRAAKEALMHALSYAYRDRRRKKREFRRLWQIRINAALKEHARQSASQGPVAAGQGEATAWHGFSYSKFIAGLKKAKIELDRKMLADLAINKPEIFKEIAEKAKKHS